MNPVLINRPRPDDPVMTEPRVVAVSGSLGDESTTRVALSTALAGAASAGADTAMVDLREYDLPVFDPDLDTPAEATRLAEEIAAADAILLGTPNYHGSYSAPLKNALDYCGFDEFEHKTVGLVTVAGGGYPIPPLDHLRAVCRSLNAWVLPRQTAIPRASSRIENGRVTDEEIEERLHRLGVDAVRYAGIGLADRSIPADENVGAE